MESSQIIVELRKKFPQFPNPRHWDQYNHDRYYFNKTENNRRIHVSVKDSCISTPKY